MLTRRSLLGAILAAGVAPTFVRSGSLTVPAPKRILLAADPLFVGVTLLDEFRITQGARLSFTFDRSSAVL
jgi:hypothetical protein